MVHFDFESFRINKPGYIRWVNVSKIEPGEVQLSTLFLNLFPRLNELIMNARVLDLIIDGADYKLFSWTSKNNNTCGWLCKYEIINNINISLLESHEVLLNNIGGIIEYYNSPEKSTVKSIEYECFTLNKHFLFLKSRCSYGLGLWKSYYEDTCLFQDKIPANVDEYVSFAEDANGDRTLYHQKTENVLLFSHDHNFRFVEPVENQPELTLYRIIGVHTFREYVETLASQWLDWIIVHKE